MNLKRAGTLTLVLSGVEDSSGNRSKDVECFIDVTDDVKPIIEFVQDFPEKWDITDWSSRPIVGKTDVSYFTNIQEKTLVLDFSVTAPNGMVYTTGLLPYNLPGEYLIQYTVRDNFGNETKISRTLTVGDFTAPTIEARTMIVATVGETVNLSAKSVDDYVDGKISDYSIVVYKGEGRISTGKRFEAKTAGEYTVVYTAKDEAGNESTVTARLIVKDATENVEMLDGCFSSVSNVTILASLVACGIVYLMKGKGGARNEEND